MITMRMMQMVANAVDMVTMRRRPVSVAGTVDAPDRQWEGGKYPRAHEEAKE
jgi:hypothetical protein